MIVKIMFQNKHWGKNIKTDFFLRCAIIYIIILNQFTNMKVYITFDYVLNVNVFLVYFFSEYIVKLLILCIIFYCRLTIIVD